MLSDRSGMALVLTLLAVGFLLALTVQLSSSVNRQMLAAANQSTLVRLDAMLVSGLNLARAALLADQRENKYDSAFDSWKEFDTEVISELLSGELKITVTDLSGRLQVNALVLSEKKKKELQKKQRKKQKRKKGNRKKKSPEKMQRALWKRFLLLPNSGIEDSNPDKVAVMLDTLADWLDKDDEERENGAEKGYYTRQEPPYVPANAPVQFLEELLLVKGWDRKILYGHPAEKQDRGLQEENDKEPSGIITYLTEGYEEGKININTAPDRVLLALHEDMTEELAADLVKFREEEENKELLDDSTWYRQVPGFPGYINFDKELITTRSSYFKITVIGSLNGLQRTGEGIVHRKKNQEQSLLRWKVE